MKRVSRSQHSLTPRANIERAQNKITQNKQQMKMGDIILKCLVSINRGIGQRNRQHTGASRSAWEEEAVSPGSRREEATGVETRAQRNARQHQQYSIMAQFCSGTQQQMGSRSCYRQKHLHVPASLLLWQDMGTSKYSTVSAWHGTSALLLKEVSVLCPCGGRG